MSLLPLTSKQEQFCLEYLSDLNATQAAIRAGYSVDTANRIATELMTKDHVRARVQELMAARSERTKITADKVLRELARIGFGDPRNVMDWDQDGVKLKPSSELTDDDAAMIQEVSQTTTQHGGSMKVKTYDKISALEKIGKHLKLFTDVSDINLNANITQMGRIQAETIDAAGNVVKKMTLTFDVGSPIDGEKDEQNDT